MKPEERNQVLEEAAKVCEKRWEEGHTAGLHWDAVGCASCAVSIRALKTNADEPISQAVPAKSGSKHGTESVPSAPHAAAASTQPTEESKAEEVAEVVKELRTLRSDPWAVTLALKAASLLERMVKP